MVKEKQPMQIAIIGMSGLFPGSSDLSTFWDNLMSEKDLTSFANKDDFGANPHYFYEDHKGKVDKCYSTRGGYIRDFDFDPSGYNIDEDTLLSQDKLYQWSLHVAKQALIDSGYYKNKSILSKCGLVLGNLSFPTSQSHKHLADWYNGAVAENVRNLLKTPSFRFDKQYSQPTKNSILTPPSATICDGLGIGGGHYSLDAACATSLYAIKLACDDLLMGKNDLMLAGAVCASDQLFIHMGFSIFHAYAGHDQLFAPFDSRSGGLVSSEGAGMVVLKRLSDAEADGDEILGVISGIGLSNDGKGKFLLSPNPKGQQLAFKRAYEDFALNPNQTSYIECHATGTPLGDQTELNSISDYFVKYNNTPLLGSVKSNMGHLLTAAGLTGLFKVLLSFKHQCIPPNLNLDQPISSENGWIKDEHMIRDHTRWSGHQAGINSFGFGGTNAHMVIQKYVPSESVNQVKEKRQSNSYIDQSLSITGMDVHIGSCIGIDSFKDLIYAGSSLMDPLPKGRWKGMESYQDLMLKYGLETVPKGAFIDHIELDLLRYKIQPKEAETLEPQQALILKVADKAIQDAGLNSGQNVAVVIAMESELSIHHYLSRWDMTWQIERVLEQQGIELNQQDKEALIEVCKDAIYHREGNQTPSQHTSFVGNIMASRIAALWDFNGPAFTVSCGERSSSKALEIAQRMIASGDVDAVVLGAVDLSAGLEKVLLKTKQLKLQAASKPGICYDNEQDGWQIGEGAAVVVLESTSSIGNKNTYAELTLHPSFDTINDLDYIELDASFGEQNTKNELSWLSKIGDQNNPCAIGSIKANIGHLEAASGLVSLVKTVLCIHHRFIPQLANWSGLLPNDLFNQNTYIAERSKPWFSNKKGYSRRAAIHFGNGIGAVVSKYNSSEKRSNSDSILKTNRHLVVIGANDQNTLKAKVKDLIHSCNTTSSPLNELVNAFQSVDVTKTFKIVICCSNKVQLLSELNYFKDSIDEAFRSKSDLKTIHGSFFTTRPLGSSAKVAFVYPGSAAAYEGLGSGLFDLYPSLHGYMEDLVPDMYTYSGSHYLFPEKQQTTDTSVPIQSDAISMMTTGVFYAAAYTHILQDIFNIQPDYALGYSMGESASMWYSLGVWDSHHTSLFRSSNLFKNELSGDLNLLAKQWNVSTDRAKETWMSCIVFCNNLILADWIAETDDVYLTFINSTNECIVSGRRKTIEAYLKSQSIRYIVVPFQNIIHHDFCREADDELYAMHHFPIANKNIKAKNKIKFWSSINRKPLPIDSAQIARNSCEVCYNSVHFPQTVRDIYQDGARIFIETGANATCSSWINSILADEPHLSIHLNKKGTDEQKSLFQALACLISHGLELNISQWQNINDQPNQKKKFIKEIKVGGHDMYTLFQNEVLQKRYQSATLNKKLVSSVDTQENNSDLISFVSNELPKNQSYTTTLENQAMEVITSKKSQINQRIGENGLRLQDYEQGEQLKGKTIIFDQEDLKEFATGKISNVFGTEYTAIDTYSRRVMLPMDPYLLVSRVTKLNAKLGEFKPSFMQTEYDIPYNAWFTTDRQIPWAVSVESGQCDLMLISYLGIDLENRGDLVYRLLDCTLTFVDDLPFEGQTLRYDISINSFVRNGDNLLFFFSYDCYVEDRLILKMRNGCAGFFTDEQLSDGQGVIYKEEEIKAKANSKKPPFTPLLFTKKRSFSKEDLRHLIQGDMEKCFDDISYFANGRNTSLRLPPEQILMIDRITHVDLQGGAYGLGLITAEKDLHPDDWYFPCHFRDDEVLAGSLQAEGGGNLLRFFMLMLGLQRMVKDGRYQPVFDLPQKVRCRKQVVPGVDTTLIYRLEVKEIGLIPNPYVIGDLEIISNGIITVHFENLGLQLREKTNPRYLENESSIYVSPRSEGALLNEKDITHFALDNLSSCFGSDFSCYDGRTVSRQPNTDLQLISRVIKIDGQRGNFKQPSTIYAEYDVPKSPWYYEQNSFESMPYSVLMEIALQPCGLLGAYLGSTLPFSDKNLFFRNLDGEGTLLDIANDTDFRGKTIKNKAVLVSSVSLAGTVLQNYTFELSVDDTVFYTGSSSFGFFPEEALAQQVGLDNGQSYPAWYVENNIASSDYMRINLDSLYGSMKLFKAPDEKPHWKLSGDQLRLIDTVILMKNGGQFGQGYLHASRDVRSYDWFFTCHFYQDPVMPGSLGVEAIFQAMQTYAIQQDIAKNMIDPVFVQSSNHKIEWKYRGQILQNSEQMHLEVHIKETIDKQGKIQIIGDAFLWNGSMRIYQVSNISLSIIDKNLLR